MGRHDTRLGAVLAALVGSLALGSGVAIGAYRTAPLLVLAAAAAGALVVLAALRPVEAVCVGVLLAPAEAVQVPLGSLGALSPTEVAFLLVAGGWVWRALIGDPRVRYPQIADYPLVALVLAVLPGAALGVELPVVARLTVMYAAFLLAFLTVKGFTPAELRRVLVCLGVGGGALAALGLVGYVRGGGPVVYGENVGGRAAFGIPDPNYFAAYLLLALLPLLALVVGGRLRGRAACAVLVGLMAAAVVASLSRGALLGVAVGVAVVVTAWVRTRVAAGAVVLAVVALTAVNINPILDSRTTEVVGDRLASVTSGSTTSNNRLDLWRRSVDVVLEKPQGIGALQFREVSSRYGITERGRPLENAHSAYVNVLTELGVVGLAAFLAWLARVAWDVRTEWRRRRQETFAIAVGVGAAFSAFAFQALTIVQYRVQTILATAFVLTGVAAAARAWPDRDEDGQADPVDGTASAAVLARDQRPVAAR